MTTANPTNEPGFICDHCDEFVDRPRRAEFDTCAPCRDLGTLPDEELLRRKAYHEKEAMRLGNEIAKVWRLRIRTGNATKEDKERAAAIHQPASPPVENGDATGKCMDCNHEIDNRDQWGNCAATVARVLGSGPCGCPHSTASQRECGNHCEHGEGFIQNGQCWYLTTTRFCGHRCGVAGGLPEGDLSPCPFCGKDATTGSYARPSGGVAKYVTCADEDCPAFEIRSTPEEWNRRVPLPSQPPGERSERTQLGKLWEVWFEQVGEHATVDVVNATSKLVIAEREIYRQSPPELAAELDAIEARLNAATPGPLGARLGSGNSVCTALASEAEDFFDEFVCDVLPDYVCIQGKAKRWEANRDFIQAAYTDIRRLLDLARGKGQEGE